MSQQCVVVSCRSTEQLLDNFFIRLAEWIASCYSLLSKQQSNKRVGQGGSNKCFELILLGYIKYRLSDLKLTHSFVILFVIVELQLSIIDKEEVSIKCNN